MKSFAKLLPLALLAFFASAAAQEGPSEAPPVLADDELQLVNVARSAIAGIESRIWPNWAEAPDRLLYINEQGEFLFTAKTPPQSSEFLATGQSAGRGNVYYHPAQFPAGLQATFNLYDSVPTSVIGSPQATGRQIAPWISVVAHEHFHQLQYSRPGYYDRVNALDLAGNDTTGMWMLNYAFPYEDETVGALFQDMAAALAAAWRAHEEEKAEAEKHDALARFLEAKARLEAGLSDADNRYLAFQLWQEGVARYTEHQAAVQAAAGEPLPIDGAGPADFAKYADDLLSISLSALGKEDLLASDKRVAFYSVGHIEALLLDFVAEGWKKPYFDGRLSLDGLFPGAH